jgi:hypothetical protein
VVILSSDQAAVVNDPSALRVPKIGKQIVSFDSAHIGRSLSPVAKKADRFGFAPSRIRNAQARQTIAANQCDQWQWRYKNRTGLGSHFPANQRAQKGHEIRVNRQHQRIGIKKADRFGFAPRRLDECGKRPRISRS